jgi:hypothetical protein
MKNLLIKWFGEKWYCNMFHTSYGIKWKPNYYRCPKCKITHYTPFIDTGPR